MTTTQAQQDHHGEMCKSDHRTGSECLKIDLSDHETKATALTKALGVLERLREKYDWLKKADDSFVETLQKQYTCTDKEAFLEQLKEGVKPDTYDAKEVLKKLENERLEKEIIIMNDYNNTSRAMIEEFEQKSIQLKKLLEKQLEIELELVSSDTKLKLEKEKLEQNLRDRLEFSLNKTIKKSNQNPVTAAYFKRLGMDQLVQESSENVLLDGGTQTTESHSKESAKSNEKDKEELDSGDETKEQLPKKRKRGRRKRNKKPNVYAVVNGGNNCEMPTPTVAEEIRDDEVADNHQFVAGI